MKEREKNMKINKKPGFVTTEDVSSYLLMIIVCILLTAGFNMIYRIYKATSAINEVNKIQSTQYQVVNQ